MRPGPTDEERGMSVSSGNAGEHLVMAELLAQGFDAYWADRGNPAFDVACFYNASGRATRLRVKTTSNSAPCWNAKKHGIFLEVQAKDDFVVICDIKNGVRGASIFVVPTYIVEEHLVRNHTQYCLKPGRNDKANIRVLRFWGEHRTDNPSYGYQEKFAEYREAWTLLK
jgi:hypothetical protein